MARDCLSTAGEAPLSKIEIRSVPWGRTWCCQEKRTPGPRAKSERLPPRRQTTSPLGRETLYTVQVLRAEISRAPSGAMATELTWK